MACYGKSSVKKNILSIYLCHAGQDDCAVEEYALVRVLVLLCKLSEFDTVWAIAWKDRFLDLSFNLLIL